jgi:hypothetical protein
MRRFVFWRIIHLPSQTSADTADALAIVIRELVERGLTCCGVIIDHAANEKRALDARTADSWQSRTRTCLIRVACLSHTLNLGIQDIIRQCVPGCDPIADRHTIIDALPKDKWGDEFYGMPTIVKTRRLCVGEITEDIAQRYPRINQQMSRLSPPHGSLLRAQAFEVFRRYNFESLSECCAVINDLIKWSDTEATRLYMVWPKVVETNKHLNQLADSGNVYGRPFQNCLRARFQKTEVIGQLLLSFLLTASSLEWYHGLPEVLPEDNPRTSNKFLRSLEPITRYGKSRGNIT